jgi:hypothetical protein
LAEGILPGTAEAVIVAVLAEFERKTEEKRVKSLASMKSICVIVYSKLYREFNANLGSQIDPSVIIQYCSLALLYTLQEYHLTDT